MDNQDAIGNPKQPRRAGVDEARRQGLLLQFLKCFAIAVVAVAVLIGGILYFNVYLPEG